MQVTRADDTGRTSPRDPMPEHVGRIGDGAGRLPRRPGGVARRLVRSGRAGTWRIDASPTPCARSGYLVGEGPSVLSIAQEVLPDGEGFRAVTHIPLPIVRARHSAAGDGALTLVYSAVVPSTDPQEGGMHLMAATWVLTMPHPSGIGS